MQYLFLLGFAGVIFGLCFLVDRLWQKWFPKDLRKVVRLPRKTVIFGIVLTFLGCFFLLNFFDELSAYLRMGCVLVSLMGLLLLGRYATFSIRYDEEGFLYRSFGKKPISCKYGDILGQRSVLTRAGVQTALYVPDGEVPLDSSMVGLHDFLKTAFSVWCRETGTDPDAVENNPSYFTYFPEP